MSSSSSLLLLIVVIATTAAARFSRICPAGSHRWEVRPNREEREECVYCQEGNTFMESKYGHVSLECTKCNRIRHPEKEKLIRECSRTQDAIVECRDGYYGRPPNCGKCSTVSNSSTEETISECNATHNAVIACKSGYYRYFSRYLSKEGPYKCLPCKKINEEEEIMISECNATQDTVYKCKNDSYRHPRVDKCVKCRECLNGSQPVLTCHAFQDTVCCEKNSLLTRTIRNGQLKVKCRTFCTAGEYLNYTTNNAMNITNYQMCAKCPPNTYMPHRLHRKTKCMPCDVIYKDTTELLSPCTATRRGIVKCKPGYFKSGGKRRNKRKQQKLGDEGDDDKNEELCKPCRTCDHYNQHCTPDHDARCCDLIVGGHYRCRIKSHCTSIECYSAKCETGYYAIKNGQHVLCRKCPHEALNAGNYHSRLINHECDPMTPPQFGCQFDYYRRNITTDLEIQCYRCRPPEYCSDHCVMTTNCSDYSNVGCRCPGDIWYN